MPPHVEQPGGPPCPQCRHGTPIVTFRQLVTIALFCPACEHAWTIDDKRHRADRRQRAERPPQDKRQTRRR